jgi:hypothetical protein
MNTPLAPSDERIELGLARLLLHVEAHPVKKLKTARQRRVQRTRLGLGAAAVAAATVTIVLVSSIAPPAGGASAQAAEILNAAAQASITASDPVVGVGQFLKVETTASYTSTDLTGSAPPYQYQYTSGIYIPANKSDLWVWKQDEIKPTLHTNPNDLPAALTRWEQTSAAEKHILVRGRPGDENSPFVVPTSYENLSREPKTLLTQLGGTTAKDVHSPNNKAWNKMTDLLETGQVPADLRATIYKAAILIPGMAFMGTDQAADGRSGDAIGIVTNFTNKAGEKVSSRQDIIINPTTGQMIGRRTVLISPTGQPTGPSGEWTSVKTTVVDTAP